MIDMDAGVSGSKKIRERKGMSLLYDLIESGQLGLVAAQDVDRFFRDVTMIETARTSRRFQRVQSLTVSS